MISDDENFSLYLYALAATAVIVTSIWAFSPQRIDVARLQVNAVDIGAIETATVPRAAEQETAGWNEAQIPWRGYEAGLAEMAQTGKPGLLVLDADWCLVCRNYQRLFHGAEVAQYADDVVFMIVDIEDEPTLQQRFNIDGDYVPRTFLLNADGSLARTATGGHERQKFFIDPRASDELVTLLESARAR